MNRASRSKLSAIVIAIPLVAPFRPAAAFQSAEADPRDARVHAALMRVYSDVRYDDIRLRDAIEHLRALLGVNVHVEWRILDEHSVAPDARVRLDLKRASGRMILELMLQEAAGETRLQFFVRDGVVVITCGDFDRSAILRTYSIRDLLAPRRDALPVRDWESDEIKVRADNLTSIITDLIEPDRWLAAGGPYSAGWLDGVLSVRAGPDAHSQLRALLTALRQVSPGEDLAILPDQDVFSAENQRARAALDEVLSSVRFGRTLGAALAWIAREYDAGMHVRWNDLRGMHVKPDRPVAMHLDNVTIREALRLLLSEQDIGFGVQQGVLMVGPGGRMDAWPTARVYSVADFEQGGSQRMNRLVEVIGNTIEPDSWRETGGGDGYIVPYDALLIVYNSARAHMEIRGLLASLRQLKGDQSAAKRLSKP